ncbi:TPA: transcriptional regulator NrdR [Candidatus Delongbacteria bacterium]|nr:MAG: transcriptional regulator NrdR [Candidatus Delongbacteria bacterium GWF2_40_14]HAQ62511.1 transcriptional regulator NrdR [Candidatus Delongbacteria bacterium]
MKCPKCSKSDSKVVDSRVVRDDTAIRRRRECSDCGYRFTTYEYIEKIELMVEKHDGTVEEFERDKVKNGIMIACRKRQITPEKIETMVNEIYNDLITKSDNSGTVKTSQIGELVMEKLKNTDEVAYIRFASVYRKFKDVKEFMSELQNIIK